MDFDYNMLINRDNIIHVKVMLTSTKRGQEVFLHAGHFRVNLDKLIRSNNTKYNLKIINCPDPKAEIFFYLSEITKPTIQRRLTKNTDSSLMSSVND